MNKILTAKEFFDEELSGEPLTEESVVEALKEFAQIHVRAALEAALEDAPTGSSTDIPTYQEMKNAILNAYPNERIR